MQMAVWGVWTVGSGRSLLLTMYSDWDMVILLLLPDLMIRKRLSSPARPRKKKGEASFRKRADKKHQKRDDDSIEPHHVGPLLPTINLAHPTCCMMQSAWRSIHPLVWCVQWMIAVTRESLDGCACRDASY
jgi:hypothetical protein